MSEIVIIPCLRDGAWTCYVSQEKDLPVASIKELFKRIEEFGKKLKDDRRSLVKLGWINDTRVVAKQPRDKNDRKWARFLSLFGKSEVRNTFIALLEFEQKGIESLKPICFLEKKKFGMVVDSWLLYEYRDGRESDHSCLPQIIQQLQLLHRHGYRHEDPNFGNFLLDADGKMFLIDCRGKARTGLYSDYYDFMLLENKGRFKRSEIESLIDVDHFSFGYMRAQAYRAYIKSRTAWKKAIGRKRSKDQQH